MKRSLLVALMTLATIVIGAFLIEETTEAQRQNRPGQRQGGFGDFSEEDIRRFRARSEAGSSQSMMKDSWAELTFTIKVDNETLMKARSLYQKAVDSAIKARKKADELALEPGGFMDWEALQEKMVGINNELKSDLKQVLTVEQIEKLEDYYQKRREERSQWGR